MENYIKNPIYKQKIEEVSAKFSKEKIFIILDKLKSNLEPEIKLNDIDLSIIIDKLICLNISFNDILSFINLYCIELKLLYNHKKRKL